MRRILRSFWTRLPALALLGLLVVLRIWDPFPVETFRLRTFDGYQLLSPRKAGLSQVTIVDIDERSLKKLGQWPWPRTILARLIKRISAAGATVIGLDILFVEEDRMSPSLLTNELRDLPLGTAELLRRLPTNDAIFAKAMAESGNVVLARMADNSAPPATPAQKAPKAGIALVGGTPLKWLPNFSSSLVNLPVLESSAGGIGVIAATTEKDNIVRRVPGLVAVNGEIYPTLGLEMMRLMAGESTIGIRTDRAGIESVFIGRKRIRTDRRGQMWLHFAKSDRGRYLSAVDVIEGKVPRARIAGSAVLIGTSVSGLMDIKSTPIERGVPGMEIHAQLIETAMSGTQLTRPHYALGAEIVQTIFVGLLIVILIPMVGAWWTFAIGIGTIVALCGASWYMFSQMNVLIDVSFAAVGSLFLYMLLSSTSYLREESRRREIRNAFSLYLSPDLVDQLIGHPERLVLEGEEREVSVMFSDIVGFTPLSEHFDAVGLTKLVNRILTPQSRAVHRARGTIDKFIGDGIMAFWNAPLNDDDHARNACRAALEMHESIARLDEELRGSILTDGAPLPRIRIGIGINTDVCYVGNMGSETRFSYSLMGSAVNLASRIEGQTRYYRVPTIVTENTWRQADGLAFIELDRIQVVGASRPIRAYVLLGDETVAASREFQALVKSQTALLEAYRSQQWDTARAELARCREAGRKFELDDLYDYVERTIDALSANPPGADWDGVNRAASK